MRFDKTEKHQRDRNKIKSSYSAALPQDKQKIVQYMHAIQ